MKKRGICLIVAGVCAAASASAQFAINTVGEAYTQNFSGLPFSSGAVSAFSNNVTLPGWSVAGTVSGAATAVVGLTESSPTWLVGGAGTDATDPGYFFKALRPSGTEDTRLGARTGGAVGNFMATFHATNATGGAVTALDLSYQASQFLAREAGEIWVYYSTDGSTWTNVPALTYVAPVVTLPGQNVFFDAAQVAASERTLSTSLTGLNWTDGGDLWVRWTFYRDVPGGTTGNAPVLAINDVSLTAVPEPSAVALIIGLCAIGYVIRRRRLSAR